MTPSRFDELLGLWQVGAATREELAELEALLRSDPCYRRAFVESIRVEVDLLRKYARAGSGPHTLSETPGRKREPTPEAIPRILKSWAAVLVAGISILAIAYFSLQVLEREPVPRVVEGQLWVGGTPARALKEGEAFEIRGETPARINLQDGSQMVLMPGSAGTFVGDRELKLAREGGTFMVVPGLKEFRVELPEGAVSSKDGKFEVAVEFTIDTDAPAPFEVAVSTGTADVEYAGAPHRLMPGEHVTYGLPAERGAALETLSRRMAIDLSTAIEKALLAVPGTAVEAGFEADSDRGVYSVHVAQGDGVRELKIDALTGAVLEDRTGVEDGSKLIAETKVSLQKALRSAFSKVSGEAVRAKSELSGHRAQAVIDILREGKVFVVIVDLKTGGVSAVSAVTRGAGDGGKSGQP
ncbi:MAG: PepSY domain-containing protein [Planctomycetes bacterium]|nr:PepSY domain-containing protein [Planctomycetota bacterium]